MNETMKRRIFIAAGAGALIGLPFVLRYMIGGGRKPVQSIFRDKLKEYCGRLDVPISQTVAPGTFEWRVAPPEKNTLKYVCLLQSFLPAAMTRTEEGVPDVFQVSEGTIECGKTIEGIPLLVGEDIISKEYCPFDSSDNELYDFFLLFQKNRFVQVVPKKQSKAGKMNKSFVHLLAMQDKFPKAKQGDSCRSSEARIKPFKGINTDYRVAGFDKIGERSTIRIHFEAKGYDVNRLTTGEEKCKFQVKNSHSGDAWFDLETGLMIRQSTEILATVLGDMGDGRTNSKSVSTFRGVYTIHLFS